MTDEKKCDNQASFLARIRREAPACSLRVLSLPEGLVLVKKGLSEQECQRFWRQLSCRLSPAELAALSANAVPELGAKPAAKAGEPVEDQPGGGPRRHGAEEDLAHCQVSVEERRQLFGLF